MKQINRVFVFAIMGLLATSCIPNKKIIYLQEKSEEAVLDSIEKSSELQYRDYTIRKNDILYITGYSNFPETNKLVQAMFLQGGGEGSRGVTGGSYSGSSLYIYGFSVDNKGYIRVPLVGEVKAGGMTLNELQKKLEEKYAAYYKDIYISVKLAGIEISILGEVNAPSRRVFYQNWVSVLEVIAAAGDLTDYAKREEVKIIRNTGEKIKVIPVDLTRKDLLYSGNYFLQPGDIIYVEPRKAREVGLRRGGWTNTLTLISTVSSILSVLIIFDVIQR